MKWTYGTPVALALMLLLLASCGAQPPPGPGVARVVVSPSALLMTASGASRQLTAQALDANGDVMDVDVSWTSSAPGTVTVSPDGLAAAVTDVGSAQIVATATGVSSAPVVTLVAQPVDGALLVPDSQVVGHPTPVDADAEYGLGWTYRVTLAGGVPASVGDVIVGTGEIALGGRAVAVETAASGALVTLELVPLEELFERLRIDETIALGGGELELTAASAAHFDATRLQDGSWQFVSKPGASPDALAAGDALAERLDTPLGPLTCESEASAMPALAGTLAFVLNPHLAVIQRYDEDAGGLQELRLTGSVETEVTFEPKFALAFSGKVACTITLGTLRAPLPGPVGLFLGVHVPMGVGFELEGSTSVAHVGVKMKSTTETTVNYTIYCEAACVDDAFTADATGTFEPSLPDPTEQFRVELRAFAFGFANLEIGAHVGKDASLELLKVQAGLAQVLDLAPRSVQVNDTDYHSGYRLVILGTASPGKAINRALKMLVGPAAPKLAISVEVPLARSPTGTFTITPDTVLAGNALEVGGSAAFTVTLDPVSYLGAYVVEGVDIVWLKDGELVNGRPGCFSMTAVVNQTTFTCHADFLDEHQGDQTFYAFVRTSLFGVSLPIALEIAKDARATLTVEESECPAGMSEACEGGEEPSIDFDGYAQFATEGFFSLFSYVGGNLTEQQIYADILYDDVDLAELAVSGTAEFHHSHYRIDTQEGTTAATDVDAAHTLTASLGPSSMNLELSVEVDAQTSLGSPPPGKGAFASARNWTYIDISIVVVGSPATFSLTANVTLTPANSESGYPTRISLGKAFERAEFYGSGTVTESGTLQPGSHRFRVEFGPETAIYANATNAPTHPFPNAQEGGIELTLVVTQ
jgi:hypothetical protein